MKACKIVSMLTILASTLAGCKSIGTKQKTTEDVRLIVTYISQNTMCAMEDGKMPQPVTKSDTVIARKNGKIGDFFVEELSNDSITLRPDMFDYFSTAFDKDKKHVILHRGETISLSMTGITDASHTVTFRFAE